MTEGQKGENVKKLVVLGATAYSEVAGIIYDINRKEEKYKVIAILDDNVELHGTKFEGVEVGGNLELVHDFPEDISFVLAIGYYPTRITKYHILKRLGLPDNRFETLIHPDAKIYPTASIGAGCIIHKGTIVYNDCIISPYVLIIANTIIGNRNLVGKGAIVASLVSTTGRVKIGNFSYIGTGSLIAENIEIGPGAMIGMGSLILKDVKSGYFTLGYPPKGQIPDVNVPQEIINEWEKSKNIASALK